MTTLSAGGQGWDKCLALGTNCWLAHGHNALDDPTLRAHDRPLRVIKLETAGE
ncbi:hypothetical protein NJL88_04880 [Streptomyces sp. DK15]|uniref:hypothetical protein n=1 Tax=Streptomyces sp. DK15 TaxID=2957499 RepID=UPI0029AF226E|nr:hypothetical protein [Streptomyces sp. DK15]MDX2389421.1 hypothetical protein [Streptomyces sp. DK15]